MFGEKSIYGQSMVWYDAKRRICLPSFTLIEPKESLLIVKNEDYLSIYKEETYEKIIEDIKKQYITFDLNKKRQSDLMLLNLYKNILKKVESEAQKRICMGGIETDKEEFLCIGAKDHVILDTKYLGIK